VQYCAPPFPKEYRVKLSLRISRLAFAIAIAVPTTALTATAADEANPAPAPVQALSPQDQAKTFQLPPGYRMELVLSEPEIKEPVVCAFDGNGRMFVAEMLTYMQDINGTDELVPTSRVSLHWSSKGDGVFDKHTVFADKLLLPRIILPLRDGECVIGETNTLDLYLHTDTNGDGVADKKELWFEGGPRGGNLEHQPSGLIWAVDNWLYTTYNSFRLRWTPGGVIKESVPSPDSQWGVGQDDFGNTVYANAGGEGGIVSFQKPPVYGRFNFGAQLAKGFKEVFPVAGVRDFQGGKSRVREPDGTLNHFTGTAGVDYYRGDRLPAELRGDIFAGEPVGRLVRRAKVTNDGGLLVLTNPYQEQKSEFLRSTDLCFRPVNISNAPDGTLYITDMYRGIIQEGNWVNPGSYLRKVVEQHSFDKITDRGRIWRLVHDTTKLGPQPQMYRETPAQLVAHLAHPNGWWRDTAQKLLVLKQDKTAVPALTQMARSHENHLARLHALWTLEGLDSADAGLVREKLKDAHPQLRVAAIRVSETLHKKGDTSLAAEVLAFARSDQADAALQAMLTAKVLKLPNVEQVLADAEKSPALGVRSIASAILHPPVQQTATAVLTPEQKKLMTQGAEIYNTLCATCHGQDGKGLPMAGAPPGHMLAPSLVGSKTMLGHRDASIYVLLHGLTGDIDGKKYEGIMIPMAANDDRWIASVLSFTRNSFGNRAGFVAPEDVARARVATTQRTQPWTVAELRAATPQPLNRKGWKVSASHNSAAAPLAIDGDPNTRFDTKAFQSPGMTFTVELLQPTLIAGIELDTAKSANDYPRGYFVELSADGTNWSKPIAKGAGNAPRTELPFEPATAKFIRITQTGSAQGNFWSIHEMQIFAAGAERATGTQAVSR
jgi:glucose/arabinose dehydrogenase/mono/diheme cytochrome c family protein